MKMININCPSCGAVLKVDGDKKGAVCEHCGSSFMFDDEVQHIQYDNAEDAGYQFEKGRQRAQAEARQQQVQKNINRPSGNGNGKAPSKKNNTWLWVLGWICIFPIPLTILLLRKKDMNPKLKYGIIAAAWIIYLLIGLSGQGKDNTVDKTQETTQTTTITESNTEESIEEKNEMSDTQEVIADDNAEIRDESLNGRGRADSGRSEPQYVNHIGYIAISSSQSYDIEKSDDYEEKEPWTVPTYVQDKQFWNETGEVLEHKTEVIVREQILEHEGYGSYSGYLLVERTDNGNQYYINVTNFITRPYWNDNDDLRGAALTGLFVAEYTQRSDYYPVTGSNEKVELTDGTVVLVKGITGTYGKNGPDNDTNQIEAIVWKEWKKGYGGVSVYFNSDDLRIKY